MIRPTEKLARKLGTLDATLIVMGGIIGSGIFMNPSLVAQRVHTAPLILAVWVIGGIVALAGSFIFADLARIRPDAGGLYGWMRDGFHPVVAFAYGWTALFVTQSGGMASAAITFAAYVTPLLPIAAPAQVVGAVIIAVLAIVNCLGVREGGSLQNVLMVLKIVAIAAIIAAGLFGTPHAAAGVAGILPASAGPLAALALLGSALVPVFFSYDGAQTAPFMDHETKDPQRTFPRALVLGVLGVVALYVLVNVSALRVLGATGLAATHTPAADVMRAVFGPIGQRIVAVAVALSTLGFLSNQILVSPRIYFDMAADGLFFRALAYVSRRTKAPVVAIATQAVVAIAIASWAEYGHVVDYVVAMDFVFFSLCAIAVFTIRARMPAAAKMRARIPFHPVSTVVFCAICLAMLLSTFLTDVKTTTIGMGILLSGVPIYFLWALRARAIANAGVSP